MPEDKPKPANPDGFSEARKSAFLLALVESGTVTGAAARAGISTVTVYEHRKKDPEFKEAIDHARHEWEQSLILAIANAGVIGEVIERRGSKIIKPGDWRALAWLLEHSPSTRERYAGILRQKMEISGDPDGMPFKTEHEEKRTIEIGPDTMDRLAKVVMVLVKAGKLRLPDPGEVINVTPGESDDIPL